MEPGSIIWYISFAVTIAVMVAILLTLIRAIRGPTVYDRILAVNAMGTSTIGLVCLMGFLANRPYFLDIGIVYAAINFIATICSLEVC